MSSERDTKIPYWTSHLTTVVSVTLVLLLLGTVAFVLLTADRESRKLESRLEVSVLLADSIDDAAGRVLAERFSQLPEVASSRLITSAEAMDEMSEDLGEDLRAMAGADFLSPEIVLSLKPGSASKEAIAHLEKILKATPGVEEAGLPDSSMMDSMRRNLTRLSWVLGALGLVMTVISIMLIANTVKLQIYARRFTIHTMRLVGATDGFIRRPFVVGNLGCGVAAWVASTAVLAAATGAAKASGFGSLTPSWGAFGIIAGALLLLSMLICGIAAAVSTTAYLRKDYAQLFK